MNKNDNYWIKKQSSKSPHKDYYFNTKTGESVWNKPENVTHDSINKNTEERNCTKSSRDSISKTPAQDRLKNVQSKLIKKVKPKQETSINKNVIQQTKIEIKKQLNQNLNEQKIIKNITKSTPRPKASSNNNNTPTLKKNIAHDRLNKLQTQLKEKNNLESPTSVNSERDLNDSWMLNTSENVPMDWEPISEEIALYEINKIRQIEQPKTIQSSNLVDFITHCTSHHPIIKEKFYFIIDTNIFISNLKFLQNTITKFSYHLNYPFLIVPYIVVQELDSLKSRNTDRNLATQAQITIRYLNNQIKLKDSLIYGQNAIESNRNLIEINNPDDKILNCCMQMKEHSNFIVLLSNDINLRNKAIINSIETYSKDDFELNESNVLKRVQQQTRI